MFPFKLVCYFLKNAFNGLDHECGRTMSLSRDRADLECCCVMTVEIVCLCKGPNK